jgi:hypothetical protein
MAKAAAPYVHPKLAAIEMDWREKSMSEMTDEELIAIAKWREWNNLSWLTGPCPDCDRLLPSNVNEPGVRLDNGTYLDRGRRENGCSQFAELLSSPPKADVRV